MKTSKNFLRKELRHLRPQIKSIENHLSTNAAEKFQNETLRPVIKLQNDLLVEVYQQYLQERKTSLTAIAKPERMAFISTSLKKDQSLRNTMLGIIIGLFTEEEYLRYIEDKRELNRRIVNMLIKRLQDQLSETQV